LREGRLPVRIAARLDDDVPGRVEDDRDQRQPDRY
jgi:hypothetical protein